MTGLRVLHAIRSDGYSGVERFVKRLALAQAAAGDEVHVIGGHPEAMSADLAAVGIGHTPSVTTMDVVRALRSQRKLTDVVNTHMTAADLAAFVAFEGRRRPRVVSTRHFASPRGRVAGVPLDAVVTRVIDAEISISRAVADAIRRPSTVVHSGLEDAPLGSADRAEVVLVAQRLQPEKATADAVAGFAASGLASDGWQLHIAGKGPEEQALRSQAADLGIADAVHLLGYRDDVPALMDRSALLLAPCPIEGLGLSVLEAMRSGLPVVAARAGGHVELLDGLDPRALYAPGDPGAAGVALRALARDASARAALAADARARQQSEYSLDAQVAGTDEVYRRSWEGR